MRTSRSLNKFFSIGKGLTIVSLALLVVCWAAGSIWAGEKQVSNKSAAKTAVPAQLTAPVMLSGDVQPDVKSLTPREEAEQLLALIRDAKDAGQQPDPAWLSRLDELTYNPTADRNPLDQGGEDWANATNILSVPYTDSGNLGALDDCVGRPFNDVFYVYNVATTGSHTIDMCTSADDTYLKIWRNPTGACTGGTTFTSDDVCGVAPSVAVSLTAGDVIYIECGRYSAGAQSAYALHVGAPARPCADCAPADGNLDPVNTAVYAQFISGDCGNGGKWSGSFTAIAGHTYHFDLCSTPPGSGTNAGFDVGPGGGDVDLKIVSSSCSIITGVDGLFNCVPAYSPNDFTWTATASGTFYVIIAPYNSSNTHTCQGDATETFTLNYYRDEPAPAPPGDVCATALPLNVPGSVSGSTLTFNNDYDYACFYTGSTSRDVVYTYTPVQTELVSLSLCGGTTNYDTKLYVYAGSCVNPPLYCNDDMCNNDPLFSPNFVSRLECVQLTGGTTYYVVVDGYGGYNGDYTLEASICVPPVNDECVDAIDLTVNGSQYCGTTSSSSDDCALVSYAEVWHTFTLTECMDVSIEYCGTTASGSLLLSIFNQGCCAAPAINPDSYEYDTCLDGLITAHYGSLPAGNYWVPVGFSNQGSYCIRVAGTACTPGVDCALPITIASLPYSDAASTVGRGNNHNPLCALETHTAPDVAYHYAPADDEWVTVSLCGSAYDSKLAIYDASNTVPGAELYCSDDYCGLQSQIDCASLLAGVTYCIVVDGWDAASGNYTLNVTNCDAPVTVYVDDDWTSQNDVDLFDDQLIWQYDAYNNIPDGIDAVVGSTVYVLPGTYPTGITHITSTMDLVGYDLLSPRPLITATTSTGGGGDARGWFLVDPGVLANFTHLAFDGSGYDIHQAIRHKGTGTIDDCAFSNLVYPGYQGFAIVAFFNYDFAVQNCEFNNIGRVGTLFFGPSPSPRQFRGNLYNGKGPGDWLDYGIELGGGSAGLLENNVIMDCEGVASSDGSTSAAVLATDYFGPGTDATCQGNVTTGNSSAYAIGYDVGDATTAIITGNKMENNADAGISSVSSALIEGTANWWGTVDGPGNQVILSAPRSHSPSSPDDDSAPAERPLRRLDDDVFGNVHYSPWVASSGNDDDLIADGWQPDLSAVGVSTNGTIQEGVDLVVGSTVFITPGTYPGQVVANGMADLNLVGTGANPGDVVIQAVASMPYFVVGWSGNVFGTVIANSSDVDISNLTVDGAGQGNTNHSFVGAGFWNSSGSLTDVDVLGVRDTPFSGVQHGVAVWVDNNVAGPFDVDLTNINITDFQKNATALSGDLVVDLDNVTITGAGPTGVTAQNGIQIGFGASGTVDDCSVSGICYTGGYWWASSVLLYLSGAVDIDATDALGAQTGVVVYDGDGSYTNGSITGTAAVDSTYGVEIYNDGLTASGRSPHVQPVVGGQPVNRRDRSRNLDDDRSFTVSGCTITGSGLGNDESYGLEAWSDGDDLTLVATNNAVEGWEFGINVYANLGTINSATVTGNTFTNSNNTYDNTAAHTWDNNCYSDFGANSGFPTQYDIPGGGSNVDLNPNVNNCGGIGLIATSTYLGCEVACVGDTLYLTFDGIGYLTGQIFLQLAAELDANWAPGNQYQNVMPGSNVSANLVFAAARRSAGNQIEVNVQWQPPYSTGNGSEYIACIPIQNVTGIHCQTLTVAAATSTFYDINGPHINAFMMGAVHLQVDCEDPVSSLTFTNPLSCDAFGNSAQLEETMTATVAQGGVPCNSLLYEAYVEVNGNPLQRVYLFNALQGDYSNTLFPNAAEAGLLFGWMTEGCNNLVLHGFDAECNEGTSTLVVTKDTAPPALAVVQNPPAVCLSDFPLSTTYGGTLLDNILDITTSLGGPCVASTGTLTISYLGNDYSLPLDVTNYPVNDADGLLLWNAIVSWVPGANGESYTFDVEAEDCAGNASTGSFTICIDLTAPANTVAEFDARPTDEGVWLKWSWNYNATQATYMEVWRSPYIPGDYPDYVFPNPGRWQVLSSAANYPQAYPPAGFSMVARQDGSVSTTATAYTGVNGKGNTIHNGPGNIYWKDEDASWVDESEDRDIYRYVTFVQDNAGNWSFLSGYTLNINADRSTNYWLGDYSREVTTSPDPSDGDVFTADLSLLSSVYFTAVPPTPGFFDIGPENAENGLGKGIPTPDGLINFSDLVPFSFNFGLTGPGTFNVRTPSAKPFSQLDAAPVVCISRSSDALLNVGDVFSVTMTLSGNSDNALKVAEAQLSFDPDVLEFVEASAGQPQALNGLPFSSAKLLATEHDRIGAAAAALGDIAVISGDFTMATVQFRWKAERASSTEITLEGIHMADAFGNVVDGEGSVLNIGASGVIPTTFALYQNYPNPFNPSTQIRFDLPEGVDVTLVIYNIMGQEVRTLMSAYMPAGAYHVEWNGLDNSGRMVGSGMYLYRINAGSFSGIKKMLLTR